MVQYLKYDIHGYNLTIEQFLKDFCGSWYLQNGTEVFVDIKISMYLNTFSQLNTIKAFELRKLQIEYRNFWKPDIKMQ